MDGNPESDKLTNRVPPPDEPVQKSTGEEPVPSLDEDLLDNSDLEDRLAFLAQADEEWIDPSDNPQEEDLLEENEEENLLEENEEKNLLEENEEKNLLEENEEENLLEEFEAKDLLEEFEAEEESLEDTNLEDEATVLAHPTENEWTKPSNDLKEIDVDNDNDPELRKSEDIEAMATSADTDEATTLNSKATDIAFGMEDVAVDETTVIAESHLPENIDALELEGENSWPDAEDPWPEDDKDADEKPPLSEMPTEAKAEPTEVAKAPLEAVEKLAEETEQVPIVVAKRPLRKKVTPAIAPILTKEFPNLEMSILEMERKQRKQKILRRAWILVTLLLLALTLGLVSQSEWWALKWHDIHSPYRLPTVESHWKKRSFGTLLLLQGKVENNSRRMAAAPPIVYISLMDKENKLLLSTRAVPGRIVGNKIINDSSEQTIRDIISLQGRKQTDAELIWSETEMPFQAIFINPPEGTVHFQVDFNLPMSQSATEVN